MVAALLSGADGPFNVVVTSLSGGDLRPLMILPPVMPVSAPFTSTRLIQVIRFQPAIGFPTPGQQGTESE